MTDAYEIQYIFNNCDILNSKVTGMSNLTQSKHPWYSLEFYIDYDTTDKQIELFFQKYEEYIRKDLNSICNDNVFTIVSQLDIFMKSQILLYVQSYVSFANVDVRWSTHSKLYLAIRRITKELDIKSTFDSNKFVVGATQMIIENK